MKTYKIYHGGKHVCDKFAPTWRTAIAYAVMERDVPDDGKAIACSPDGIYFSTAFDDTRSTFKNVTGFNRSVTVSINDDGDVTVESRGSPGGKAGDMRLLATGIIIIEKAD